MFYRKDMDYIQMLTINYNYKLFSLSRVWFCESAEFIKSDSDIIRLLRYEGDFRFPNGPYITDEAYTLVHDLTAEKNDLINTFKKNVSYEIKRAKNEVLDIFIYDSNQLKENKDILNDFYDTFEQFCVISQQETLIKDLKKELIATYIEYNCFMLTLATYENGKVYHAYVYDKENAVLIHSASDFRNKDVNKQVAGRTNKLLHYEDMIKFKEMGVKQYDWGNLSDGADLNGIDLFKLSFGGSKKLMYNIYFPGSLKGKILILLKKIFDQRSH